MSGTQERSEEDNGNKIYDLSGCVSLLDASECVSPLSRRRL